MEGGHLVNVFCSGDGGRHGGERGGDDGLGEVGAQGVGEPDEAVAELVGLLAEAGVGEAEDGGGGNALEEVFCTVGLEEEGGELLVNGEGGALDDVHEGPGELRSMR